MAHHAEEALNKDLSKIIAETVIQITKSKKDELNFNSVLLLKESTSGNDKKIKEGVSNVIELFKSSFQGDISTIFSDEIEEQAFKDVGLYINHLVSSPDNEVIGNECLNISIFLQPQENQKEKKKENPANETRNCGCIVMPVKVILESQAINYYMEQKGYFPYFKMNGYKNISIVVGKKLEDCEMLNYPEKKTVYYNQILI